MKVKDYSTSRDSAAGQVSIPYRRQEGAVLIISLLILLIMTLIGVTAMSTTSLEEKMTGNMRDKNVALQASESALEDGEAWLSSQGARPVETSTCASPPCAVWDMNVLPDLASQTQDWWLSNAHEYGTGGTKDIGDVMTDPHYVIEEQAFVRDNLDAGQNPPTGKSFYRVTAHGTGGTDEAQVVLQSTYVKRFN
jgi:type IV pilus assembly protein PilX